MINILNFYEAGKTRSGTALFPINGGGINIYFSTRHGNAVVDWGDGTTSNWTTLKYIDYTLNPSGGNILHSYSANYNGNISIKFLQGLRDVYSFNTTNGLTSQKINILDFGAFINQFPNLYSIRLYSYAYNVYADMGVIKGDLANIPASVERYVCESFEVKDNATDVWFNFSSLPANSKLKILDFSGEVGVGTRRKILGNLANLPVGCSFVKISRVDNSEITYTAGKVWASSFDTLSIPISLGNFLELDSLYTDMGNSITSAVGGKVISIGGWVTQKSLAGSNYLTGLGFTLTGSLDTSTGTASSTTQKFIGDIAQIPSDVTFFKIVQCASGSAITYTSGKAWASAFDTLSIPLVLTTAELDNLLIDMDNSITTKIGAGVITLLGWRGATSDAAVASLQAKGFTVNIKVKKIITDSSVIFRMDFQNNYNVWSNSLIDITSGNGVGSEGNLPTFALSGRKEGEYCAVFNGSQSIKTTTNLPINSDKVTVEFGMKTTQTALAILLELSENMNTNNSFGFWTNNGSTNKIDGLSRNSNYNTARASLTHNGNWNHIAMVIDRAENATNEVKLYINGNLATVTKPLSTDNIGNFINNILYIGQRAGNTLGFNGSLMYLKAYNFAKTAGEVSTANSDFIALGAGTPPPTGKKVAVMGDSTITYASCRTQTIASILFTPAEISSGWEAVNLAVGGHTINQQKTVWNNDANKATYDIIIIQVGLNDMNTAIATTLTNYQNLINQINATKKAGAKVYISCMLPCKQRWTDLGWVNGQSNWVALNNAIMGSTFTGVDKRNNAHVALLDDGNGNLAAAYDCGDHIHENNEGADIIKNAFRAMIF